MSKRFSTEPIVDGDRVAEATALHQRAAVLVERRLLPADYSRQCLTLADVRRMVESAEPSPRKPVDVETMRARIAVIEAALESGETSTGAALELLDEMAALGIAIEKADGRIDDYAEARREARFGGAL